MIHSWQWRAVTELAETQQKETVR